MKPFALRLNALAVLSLMLTWLADGAHASTSATVAVRGVISHGACRPHFDSGARIDFGNIALHALESDRHRIKIGERMFTFTVVCSKPVAMRLIVRDEQAGTAVRNLSPSRKRFQYGLGKQGDRLVGSYMIYIYRGKTSADGKGIQMSAMDDGPDSWHYPAETYTAPDRWLAWSRRDDRSPQAFKTFSATFAVMAYLPLEARRDLADDIRLDGRSSFEIQYH